MKPEPGYELNALVAERVMGWKLVQTETGAPASPSDYELAAHNDGWHWEGDPENREAWEFQPSTDIKTAWEVVEKLRPELLFVIETSGALYVADFGRSGDPWKRGSAPTAPHAICLAALRASGVEIQ